LFMDWQGITLVGTAAGTLGTGAGAVLALGVKRPTDKLLGMMLGFSAGIMLAIVFLELLEEALKISFFSAFLGLLLGVVAFVLLDSHFPHKHFIGGDIKDSKGGLYLKKGALIAIGVALHNFPEGMAIGAGFTTSSSLGVALAVLIALHNIPEGLAVALPLQLGGTRSVRAFLITALAGLPMGAGALVGALLGTVSTSMLGISLGFAGGAMLYIVCDELIPDVYQLTGAHAAIGGISAGVLLGMALIHYL